MTGITSSVHSTMHYDGIGKDYSSLQLNKTQETCVYKSECRKNATEMIKVMLQEPGVLQKGWINVSGSHQQLTLRELV